MRARGYKYAVEWIALNDDWDPTTVEEQAAVATVVLVADLYDVDPAKVAADVLKRRAKEEAEREGGE